MEVRLYFDALVLGCKGDHWNAMGNGYLEFQLIDVNLIHHWVGAWGEQWI